MHITFISFSCLQDSCQKVLFLSNFRNCTGSDEGTSHFVHGRHVKVKPSFSSSYEANTASNKVFDLP